MSSGIASRDSFGEMSERSDTQKVVQQPTGTFLGTTMCIVKNVVGSGVLNLPGTFYSGGPASAIIWMLIMGIVNAICFWLLGVLSEGRCLAYGDVWTLSLGRYSWLCDMCICFNGALTLMSYLTVIGQQFPAAAPGWFGEKPDRFSWQLFLAVFPIGIAILYPICLAKDLSFLKWPSMVGLICTFYTIIFVVVEYARFGYIWKDDTRLPVNYKSAFDEPQSFSFMDMIGVVALYSSAYICHYNAPLFYKELRNRTPKKFLLISLVSFMIVFLVFLLFALLGYMRFGSFVHDNVLTTFQDIPDNVVGSRSKDGTVKVAWLGIMFSVMASYPLVNNSTRAAFFRLVWSDKTALDIYYEKRMWYCILTLVGVIVASFVGWSKLDLSIINRLKGATTTIFIATLFPGLFVQGAVRWYKAKFQLGDSYRLESSSVTSSENGKKKTSSDEPSYGPSRSSHFAKSKVSLKNWAYVGYAIAAVGGILSILGIVVFIMKTGKLGNLKKSPTTKDPIIPFTGKPYPST